MKYWKKILLREFDVMENVNETRFKKLEEIVTEMYEEFLMSAVCSEYYSISGQESEAQDIISYLNYMEHAEKCRIAAKACKAYIESKNEIYFVNELQKLGLINNVLCMYKLLGNHVSK